MGLKPHEFKPNIESVARVGLNDFEMKFPFKFVDSKVMPDWFPKVMPVATV